MMNPIYEVKNGSGGNPGTTIDLGKLLYVGRVNGGNFVIEQAGNAKYSQINPGGIIDIQQHRSDLIKAWGEYQQNQMLSSNRLHKRHRIVKGDDHAFIDLYQVLYVGAMMELSDGKHGFSIILRETGKPINIAFDTKREALMAHVALDNAYGDYLESLNEQGV